MANRGMRISTAMIEQIKQFEGCKLEAYRDVAGVPTIGIGHTGKDVMMGDKISGEEAIRLFREDVSRFEDAVNRLDYKIQKNANYCLAQCEFDALVSLCYNVGSGCIMEGTTLYRLLMDSGTPDKDFCHAFMLWTKARINGELKEYGGKDGKHGLVRRRAIEAAWFLYGDKWTEKGINDVVEWARS